MPSQTNLASTYVLLVFIWATTPLAIVWSVSIKSRKCKRAFT
ncbi:hypothetical protein ACFMJT_09210, partial [Acinetobacter baumannii]